MTNVALDRLVLRMPDAVAERTPDAILLDLVARGGARSGGAWLVREYAEDVYTLCRAIVRDRDVAEDLAHDAFARALDALTTYRGDASPRTWLLTIARHRCFDHLRAAKRERALLFDDSDAGETHADDVPSIVDQLTSAESLRLALDALDEGDRALVVLRHGHAMDYASIAEVFGVREGAIRMRLSRATARMRDAIDGGQELFCVLDAAEEMLEVQPAPAAARAIAPRASAPMPAPGALPFPPSAARSPSAPMSPPSFSPMGAPPPFVPAAAPPSPPTLGDWLRERSREVFRRRLDDLVASR